MNTYSAKPSDVEKKWYIIDAEGLVLGRLATLVAKMIRGKHKAMFTPHIDCGDHIIIINAEKVHMTGKKDSEKVYYHHTGYPGGIKENYAGKMLEGKFAQRVIEKAIQRMMPKGPLGRQQFASNLRVYKGSEHPHTAQKPEVLDVAGMNSKNVKGATK